MKSLESNNTVPTRSLEASAFERAPYFGTFSNWMSGSQQSFETKAQLSEDCILFVDRGNFAGLLWASLTVTLLPLALYVPIFMYEANKPHVYKLGEVSYVMLSLVVIFMYRAIRAFTRRSFLRIDLRSRCLLCLETWPTRRKFSIPINQSRWIIQPLRLPNPRGIDWNGFILRVAVGQQSFVIACKQDPRHLRAAIPSEMRQLIRIECIRDTATAHSPM